MPSRVPDTAAARARIDAALARAVLTGTREDTDAVRLVLRWVDSDRRGLLLRGGVGAGKSFAAALAERRTLRAAVDQNHVALDASVAGAREVAFFPPVTGG